MACTNVTRRFSPYFPGSLTSSGTGHIRFWKMASTFTGLKLQVRCNDTSHLTAAPLLGPEALARAMQVLQLMPIIG